MNELIQRIREHHKTPTSVPVGVLAAHASETQAKEAGQDRLIRIVVTTDDIDLVGEVVDPNGVDTSYINARKQNKAFVDHRYDISHCIGSIRYLSKWPTAANVKGLQALISLRKGNDFADDCWAIAKEMGIGASIGFEASEVDDYKDGSDPVRWKGATCVIRKWKLLEVSLTCFPCNVACQSQEMEMVDEEKSARLAEMVTKGMISKSTAESLGLSVHKPKLRIVSGLRSG